MYAQNSVVNVFIYALTGYRMRLFLKKQMNGDFKVMNNDC